MWAFTSMFDQKDGPSTKLKKKMEKIYFSCSRGHDVVMTRNEADKLLARYKDEDIICGRCLTPWEFGEKQTYGDLQPLKINIQETLKEESGG